MFETTMRAAIDAARTLAQADSLSRALWQAHGSGVLADATAQALAERLHDRRGMIRADIRPVGIPAGRASLFPARRYPVSPDRLASRERRRRLAASGPMPPQLAARFTTGQLAVLRIIGDEFAAGGVCGLCIDAIAARAGVCRRSAQAALRLAEGDGLLTVQERRRQGDRNRPNLVRIINREWSQWLRRARRQQPQGGGCRTLHPTGRGVSTNNRERPAEPSQGLPGRQSRPPPRDQSESQRPASRPQPMQ